MLITEAILALKQQSNFFKDYLFPISTAFFSAFAGGVSAYYFNRRQDRGKEEKENFKSANKIYLELLSVHSSLMVLKSSYCDLIETNPLKRAILINPGQQSSKKIDFDLSLLSFIKDVGTANKSISKKIREFVTHDLLRRKRVRPSIRDIEFTWRNLKRLSVCIANYNCLLDIFEARFKLDVELRESLIPLVVGMDDPQIDVIFSVIPHNVVRQYLYESEMALVITDHIIKELFSFSKNFPEIAESNIELSLVGKGAKLLRSSLEDEKNNKIISNFTSVNYDLFSKYTGIPIEQLPKLFTFYGGN